MVHSWSNVFTTRASGSFATICSCCVCSDDGKCARERGRERKRRREEADNVKRLQKGNTSSAQYNVHGGK